MIEWWLFSLHPFRSFFFLSLDTKLIIIDIQCAIHLLDWFKINLDDLTLTDDEGLCFELEEESEVGNYPNLCLVSRFPVNQPFKMKPMKVCMPEVWRLMKVVPVKETFLGVSYKTLMMLYLNKISLESMHIQIGCVMDFVKTLTIVICLILS